MEDLIFWYTGVAAWSVLGATLFCLCCFSIVHATTKSYFAVRRWQALHTLMGLTPEMINEVQEAFPKFSYLTRISYDDIKPVAKKIMRLRFDKDFEASIAYDAPIPLGSTVTYQNMLCKVVSRGDLRTWHIYDVRPKDNEDLLITNLCRADFTEVFCYEENE